MIKGEKKYTESESSGNASKGRFQFHTKEVKMSNANKSYFVEKLNTTSEITIPRNPYTQI